MAVFTVSNSGGNINSGSTYVGGIVPTSTDSIAFTSTSGQLTVNSSFTIASIDFTNYANTITFSQSLTVNGNVTLSPTMSFAGVNGLVLGSSTITLTSNGVTFPNSLILPSISSTITLSDDWSNSGAVYLPNVIITTTINGNTFNISGTFRHANGNTVNGTTILNFNGTSTYIGLASGYYVMNTVTINTTGTLTLSGNINFGGNITYISGTVNAGTSTLYLRGSIAINTNGISFYNLSMTNGGTINLISNLTITNNTTLGVTANVTFNNSTLYIGGNLTISNNVTISGTTNIILNGTGIWSANATGVVKNNLTINTSGTITISGTVYYNTGTLNYISGTVITTSSTLSIVASTTLNTNGISFSTINAYNTIAITLLSNLTCQNYTQVNGSTNFIGLGLTILVNGNFTHSGTLDCSGNATIKMCGTGTIQNTSSGSFLNTIVFDTIGTITIGTTLRIKGGTITYISGTIITTGSTLNIIAASTLDTNGVTWNSSY